MAEKESNVSKPRREVTPDQIEVNAIQAERLATLSGVDVREIVGRTVADLSERLRWRIDPELFLFRRICGRVVKKDPVTGIEQPVAYATVHVEDTDCSLLGYFPKRSPWAWYFPFRCRREVLTTVKTDRCGNFCVYVPRWDIDRILHWRKQRVCYQLFDRVRISDLLNQTALLSPVLPSPQPGPDPDPRAFLDPRQILSRVEQQLGGGLVRKLSKVLGGRPFEAQAAEAETVLQEDAFDVPLPPPLPSELRAFDHRSEEGLEGVRTTFASRLNFDTSLLRELDLRRYVGPFLRRCVDQITVEWMPIFDVPDITFRVTQDIDGDGSEEEIYSEGYFQVRWDAGSLPDVKLVASPVAISVPDCEGYEAIPCGNVPEIVRAGRMPVRGDVTMYDPVAGYAVRPNRPHPSGDPGDGLPRPQAETPFHGTLPLFGCVNIDTPATHYRILDSYSADGATFTPFLPMLDQSWWVTRLDASGMVSEYAYVTPDTNGWYPIEIPRGTNPNAWEPPNLLLDWNTRRSGDGQHILKIELGTPAGPLASQPPTDPVAFRIDNTAPITALLVEYRKNGVGPFLPLGLPCPVVRRGALSQSVEFRLTFTAASRHLRDVSLAGGGCGAGDLIYASGAPADWYVASPSSVAHWHVAVGESSASVTASFTLAATAQQGTYVFAAGANSRAINPAGGDTGHRQTPMYQYDTVDIHAGTSLYFSVIDAD
jgi:hypothetical protein